MVFIMVKVDDNGKQVDDNGKNHQRPCSMMCHQELSELSPRNSYSITIYIAYTAHSIVLLFCPFAASFHVNLIESDLRCLQTLIFTIIHDGSMVLLHIYIYTIYGAPWIPSTKKTSHVSIFLPAPAGSVRMVRNPKQKRNRQGSQTTRSHHEENARRPAEFVGPVPSAQRGERSDY